MPAGLVCSLLPIFDWHWRHNVVTMLFEITHSRLIHLM